MVRVRRYRERLSCSTDGGQHRLSTSRRTRQGPTYATPLLLRVTLERDCSASASYLRVLDGVDV